MDSETFRVRLDDIDALLYELVTDVEAEGIDGNEGDVAQAAYDFWELVSRVKDAYSLFSTDVISRIEATPEPIFTRNGGTVEIKTGEARKKWDHAAAIQDVAKRIVESAVDMETGEVKLSPQQMVERLAEFAGIQYWRVKAMKDIGLSANNYCEVGESNRNLVVRRPK